MYNSDTPSSLEQVLRAQGKRPFTVVEPGGNFGDGLIYFGFEALARELGIQIRSVNHEKLNELSTRPEEVIYLHGSGGFNHWSSGRALAVLSWAISKKPALIIQGPCTIDEYVNYLEQMAQVINANNQVPLAFFAREETTYRLCQEHFRGESLELYLDQDTAFWADRKMLVALAGRLTDRYRLYALREDNEIGDIDVYDQGKGVQLDPAYFSKSFPHWVRIHLQASEIITNRTHSAIVGALLGKQVTMYPGRYHKNSSIWENSLKDMGVRWGPDLVGEPYLGETSILHKLPQLLCQSYKLNQLLRWFQKVPLY